MVKVTQQNFNDFCKGQVTFAEALNHRMTNVEDNVKKMQVDVVWIKRIGYYMAATMTGIVVKSIFFS